jgi:ADP-ribose pyrophosphatase YjhB (NUDIX family)
MMQPNLVEFLSRHIPLSEEEAVWGNGTLPLRITTYLADVPPPLEFVTSVRALVFHRDQIVVIQDPTGFHIVPGGRRESGESLDKTLRREVLEETGWLLADSRLLGFMHFHHLAPKPEGYQYPYPDFLQMIYAANADPAVPPTQAADEWVLASHLWPIEKARDLDLAVSQLHFLDAALTMRAAG